MTSSSETLQAADAAPKPEAPPQLEPPKPDAVPRQPARGALRRIVSTIGLLLLVAASAVAGGFIARFVILPFGPGLVAQNDTAELQAQVASLRAELAAADLGSLRARLGALEQEVKAGGTGGATPAEISDLAQRLSAVEQTVATLGQSLGAAAAQPSGSTGQGASSQDLANLTASMASLKTDLADLSNRLGALSGTLQSANQNLAGRLAALEQAVPANLVQQLAGAATKSDLEALSGRVASLEKNTNAFDAKRAAAAVALADLARAAESGAPFTAELEAVRFLKPDPALLAALAPYAEKGVKPAGVIGAEFDAAARGALRAERASSGDWWNRLWANISGLFLVRRTGALQGTSTQAILARAGEEASHGDLKAALEEISPLKGPAAAALSAWKGEAEARVALDALIAKATSALLAALNAQAGP